MQSNFAKGTKDMAYDITTSNDFVNISKDAAARAREIISNFSWASSIFVFIRDDEPVIEVIGNVTPDLSVYSDVFAFKNEDLATHQQIEIKCINGKLSAKFE